MHQVKQYYNQLLIACCDPDITLSCCIVMISLLTPLSLPFCETLNNKTHGLASSGPPESKSMPCMEDRSSAGFVGTGGVQ